ncbi:MAG TPA: DoxX family protein [Ktedonobacterales bacterium]
MNVILWIVQCLLAVAYLLAGAPKASLPITALSKRVDWIGAVPAALVRFIGVAELLGAIGLILPMLTGILPWLTVAAAMGLAVLQVCATLFHITRGEMKSLPMNVILLLLSLFVIVGRVFIVPVM